MLWSCYRGIDWEGDGADAERMNCVLLVLCCSRLTNDVRPENKLGGRCVMALLCKYILVCFVL